MSKSRQEILAYARANRSTVAETARATGYSIPWVHKVLKDGNVDGSAHVFCVYAWFERGAVVPFYVGSGRYERAMSQHHGPEETHRRELGHQFVCVIEYSGLNRHEAFTIERQIIKEKNPKFNKNNSEKN